MDKLQTEALLILVSTYDQRKVSEETVLAWSRLLVATDPVRARLAVEEHFATRPDTYLSIGHVVAGAKKVAVVEGDSAAGSDRREDERGWVGVDCPECRHGVSLVKCDVCCLLLAESGLAGRALWNFADQRCLEQVPF
jgi:hypothetical protein